MIPFWQSDNAETTLTLYQGHVLDVLRQMPAESVHCVMTSPPYWGLRDYKLPSQVWGGEKGCEHDWDERRWYTEQSAAGSSSEAFSAAGNENAQRLKDARWRSDATCLRCSAWRGSLGLEPTPELYVQHLVEIFREVRRVLRRDGTLWLNMGDSYATGAGTVGEHPGGGEQGKRWKGYRGTRGESPMHMDGAIGPMTQPNRMPLPGLKPKDLIGIPWRVAFALQDDGWWLRSDIVWSKPNPMPESVTDRPTKAHEYVFLLAKAKRYYYDADAIREPHSWNGTGWAKGWMVGNGLHGVINPDGRTTQAEADAYRTKTSTNPHYRGRRQAPEPGEPNAFHPLGRNKRTVWEIPTEPYPEAHFATFPQKLVEPCILAGTSEKGVCPECGAPWERETGQTEYVRMNDGGNVQPAKGKDLWASESRSSAWTDNGFVPGLTKVVQTLGWKPGCTHGKEPTPATVLDPFAGSGTTLLVAQRLGRNGVGIELSEDYCRLSVKRLEAEHAQMGLTLT